MRICSFSQWRNHDIKDIEFEELIEDLHWENRNKIAGDYGVDIETGELKILIMERETGIEPATSSLGSTS